jgi:exo-1,4-beta-D-glucosaminidase
VKKKTAGRIQPTCDTICPEADLLIPGRRAIIRNSKFIVRLIPCGLTVLLFLLLATLPSPALANSSTGADPKLFLRDHWMLQSSCQVKAAGEQISAPGFRTTGWHPTSVPSTVVAALVADKTYPDPYFGMNLRSIPGTTYPIGKNFADLPMPRDSPFHCSWWYRTEFLLPENYEGHHVLLNFSGINYRANIWINGRRLAAAEDVAGMFRTYEFDVTPLLAADHPNALAVETFAQTETDLGINWQDWNPAPPDKNMGLWSDVFLQASGPVTIRHPEVVTHFPEASLDQADLSVIAELHNVSHVQVTGYLDGFIDGVNIRETFILKPKETRTVRFTPDRFPQLRTKDPKLWWPAPLGPQNLHDLSLRFMIGNDLSDSQKIRFGIREITSELNAQGYRQFRVNGRKILIRGGGWTQDMLLRRSPERLDAQLRYVRDMNLNTIRLEGQMESDDFFDLADERGILVMPGWACCTYWQLWPKWKPSDLKIASESLRSQILRLRSHPSVLVWLNASDVPPPPAVEKAYLDVLKETDWPNPIVSSAAGYPSTVTGASGMKMTGPYDFVPPSYWLTDPGRYGGAWGLNTETSPGPAIPTIGSLKKMLPADHLWPIDKFWSYHAASERFSNVDRFNRAMNSMFGPPAGLDDYVTKSQAMTYDAERAMFEAYARNKYKSTGVIQWMLNNGWPSLYWHLFDYYLQPAGGYFGTKKGCEPLHIQYSYDDHSVVVVNNLYQKFPGLSVTAELYDFDLQKKFSQQVSVDAEADSVQRALTMPALPSGLAPAVYFVNLALRDSSGKLLSSNFYWLSSRPAEIQWKKTVYFDNPPPKDLTYSASIYTPASPYDDLTQLNRLARVRIAATATVVQGEPGPQVHVTLRNPSDHLAFQVRLGIHSKGQEMEILPVLWEDNYIELLPGESREVSAQYLSPGALNGSPELTVSGWNIEPVTIPLAGPSLVAPQAHGGSH